MISPLRFWMKMGRGSSSGCRSPLRRDWTTPPRRLQHRDPVLGIAPHGVTIPLQKATVPHGQQVPWGPASGSAYGKHWRSSNHSPPNLRSHDRRFHRLSAPLRIVEENQGRFQAALHPAPAPRRPLAGRGASMCSRASSDRRDATPPPGRRESTTSSAGSELALIR